MPNSVLSLDSRPIADGDLVNMQETSPLRFNVTAGDEIPRLLVAGDEVPLVRDSSEWHPEPEWLSEQSTQHLVGDLDVVLQIGHFQLHAIVRRLPSRITLDEYHFLLHALRERLGARDIEDPLGRTRIWAALAPRVPPAREERARVLVAMFERAAIAFRRVAASPRRSLTSIDDWMPVRAASRAGRIDARRLRHADPPRPADRPREGSVLVSRVDESIATAENRYVVSVVRRLADELARTLSDEDLPRDVAARVRYSLNELDAWFGTSDWSLVPPGPVPHHSFVLRDDPDYAVVSSIAVQLDRLPGLLARFPPTDPEVLFPLNPYSLNVLYERWIQMLAFDWIAARLGPPPSSFAGSGSWAWHQGRVVLRLDVPYPRRSAKGVVAPVGKNKPDVAIECWTRSRVDVLTLDATYSRNVEVLDSKLQYAANLRQAGVVHPLTGEEPLVVRWAAFARPGGKASVVERAADLRAVDLSLPPGDEGTRLLARYLESTIGAFVASVA